MEIFIARHGQTNLNNKKRLAGNSNLAQLNKKGKKHAKKLAEFLEDKKIGKIYSSPLERAKATATPLAKKLKQKVIIKKDLREFDFGTLDGADETREGKKGLENRRVDLDYKFPEGESYNEVIKRVDKCLRRILRMKLNKILIVGHGGVNRVILSNLTNQNLKKSAERLDTIDCPNEIIYIFDTKTKEIGWVDSLTKERGNGLLRRTGV